MSTHPERGDDEFTHDEPGPDPLGEIYSGLVTPDIEEINEHAAHLAQETDTEPDRL